MNMEDFELGDLVEVVNLNPTARRVLAGQTSTIHNGETGIVVEKYREDNRVKCGSIAAMKWEANLRPDELRVASRLGHEETHRRLLE